MGTDLETLDEFFPERATNNARAGFKFQPKAKPNPRKEAYVPLASMQPIQTAVVDASLDSSEILEKEKPLENNENFVTGVHSSDDSTLVSPSLDNVVPGECLGHNVDLHSNDIIPNLIGEWPSTTEKSTGENADIFIGLESLDDFYSQPATSTASAARSPDKVDLTVNTGNVFAVIHPVNDNVQAARVSYASSVTTCPDVNITKEPFTCREAVVSENNIAMETEEVEDIPSLETLDNLYEITTPSGYQNTKFQPKPKFQVYRDRPDTSNSILDGFQSDLCFQDAQSVPSESEFMNEGSIPAFTSNDVLDFSSLKFGDSTSHFPVNEKPANFLGNPQSDAFLHGEPSAATPEIPEKENEASRSTRQLRRRINACKLVDESEEEAHDDENIPNECPSGSLVDEDENDDDEYQSAKESQNKRVPTKPKRSAPQKEKSAQKRKKPNEVPDHATKDCPKKFSHSSRRKRRQVDKVLIETPEDEIDVQKLRIRDLILLAEYRERMSSKEGNTTGVSSTNQSAGNSFANHNDEDTFTSQVGGSSNDQTNPTAQESFTYTNYQSYMKKTPRSSWSKQDTELFYEAVRQFGSDISMIQQLFPGRTRNQVKLKYKKEERQHPLRLHEALTSRAKDHSHFQLVIERLQQTAAEEKQNLHKDDTTSMMDNEEELDADINEEVSKSEQVEEVVEAMKPDVSPVQSPVKACDSEDDLDVWSQYTSEL